jgi:hypothetical protein
MCTCVTTPGGTIICDFCASQMIEVTTDLLGVPVELPEVLTPTELEGMASLVNNWFDMQQQEGARG